MQMLGQRARGGRVFRSYVSEARLADVCDELPTLLGVPLQSDRVETVRRPLDKQRVLTNDPERSQRERLEVGARLQKANRVPLDDGPPSESRERVEAGRRRRRRSAP
jgi:hypothetical protein